MYKRNLREVKCIENISNTSCAQSPSARLSKQPSRRMSQSKHFRFAAWNGSAGRMPPRSIIFGLLKDLVTI